MKIPETIIKEVQKGRVAIENTMEDPYIQSKVDVYGFTAEKMLDGKNKVISVQNLLNKQQADIGQKLAATDSLNTIKASLDEEYYRVRKVGNIAFRKDRAVRHTLGINGKYPKTYPVWLEKNHQLYTNALADDTILARFADFGITKAELEADLAALPAVSTAFKQREQKIGESQQTTFKRNQEYKEFKEWIRDFYPIAALALKDEPQLLEKLGIMRRS